MNGRTRQMRHWVAGMFCALALLLSGISHHPVASTLPADISDYVLPDGSLPDLCLTGDLAGGDHSGGDHRTGHDCGTCCLSVAATLPQARLAAVRSNTRRPSGAALPVYHSILPPVLDPGLGARAPPFTENAAA